MSDDRAIYILHFNSIFPLRSCVLHKRLRFPFTEKEINEKRGYNNFLPYVLKVWDKTNKRNQTSLTPSFVLLPQNHS